MRNKQWSDEDKAVVTKHYGKMDIRDIGKAIDRTYDAIRQFASANGLTADFEAKPWTREELLFLKKNINKIPINDMCSMLERTKSSVAAKLTILRAANGLLPMADKNGVQKDIPFYAGKQAQYRALMGALELNESFEYPAIERQTVANCMPYFQDKIFSTKRIDDNTRRCWRII